MFKLFTNVVHEAVVTRLDPIIKDSVSQAWLFSPPKMPEHAPEAVLRVPPTITALFVVSIIF